MLCKDNSLMGSSRFHNKHFGKGRFSTSQFGGFVLMVGVLGRVRVCKMLMVMVRLG